MRKDASHITPVWLCATLLLLLCNCKGEDAMYIPTTPAISFFRTTLQTKAASDSLMQYTDKEFGVSAGFYSPDATTGTRQNYMDNIKVTSTPAGCTTEATYYWPINGEMHFSAYSPYVPNQNMPLTLPESPYAGYRFDCSIDGHTNLMFADEQAGTQNDFNNGTVPIIFRHALTKLTFTVRTLEVATDETSWSIVLNNISLKNIRKRGNVTFTHKEGIPNNWYSNSEEIWNTKEFAVGSAYDPQYLGNHNLSTSSVKLTETPTKIADSLYVMPQKLHTSDKSEYIQTFTVDYTVDTTMKDMVTNEITTTAEERTTEIPLATTAITHWRINQHINYNVTISAINPILFDPTTNVWIDNSTIDIQ